MIVNDIKEGIYVLYMWCCICYIEENSEKGYVIYREYKTNIYDSFYNFLQNALEKLNDLDLSYAYYYLIGNNMMVSVKKWKMMVQMIVERGNYHIF